MNKTDTEMIRDHYPDATTIIQLLAESDPTYESGMGDLYCVFCGPLDYGEGHEMIHDKACVWLLAQEVNRRNTNQSLAHVGRWPTLKEVLRKFHL